MRVAVCIKQVPKNMDILMDKERGTLVREGNSSIINPYDLIALETALRIKESVEGEVISITMGPESAKEIIRESYTLGVDEGVILSDKLFSGADVFATSYTLSEGIKKIGEIDVVVCGKQTIDGDTSQVGQGIAKHLGIPHIYNVTKILDVKKESLIVEQDLGREILTVVIKTPCVLIMAKNSYTPRIASLKLKLSAKKKEVRVLTASDIGRSNKETRNYSFGLKGSPTKVVKANSISKNMINKNIIKESLEVTTDSIWKSVLKRS